MNLVTPGVLLWPWASGPPASTAKVLELEVHTVTLGWGCWREDHGVGNAQQTLPTELQPQSPLSLRGTSITVNRFTAQWQRNKTTSVAKRKHAGDGAWQKEFLSVPNLPSLVSNVLVLFLNSTCRWVSFIVPCALWLKRKVYLKAT